MLRWQQDLPISTSSETGPAGDCPARPRSGLTLVEMMVAIMIVTVGLLGLAGSSAYVIRQVSGGANQSIAANAIQSRLEWMRSVPCSQIKDSTATNRGVREHWVPGPTHNGILWVRDTIRYSVGGTPRTQTYTMTVPCR
jgi:prepilin-type N-terminal cleavage/methylation domain-containing protein